MSDTDTSLLLTSTQEAFLGLHEFKTENDGLLDSLYNENFIDLNNFVSDSFAMEDFNTHSRQLPMTATGILPSIEDYPGQLEFSVELLANKTCGKSWIYSTALNKIFINKNNILPVRFQWKQNMVMSQLRVRALLVFTRSQDFKEPVKTCFHHASPLDTFNENFLYVDHIVRSEHPAAIYQHDEESDRLSVVVPLGHPQPGDDYVTGMYTFQCKNSCVSGMNRRPTRIIFTLEDDKGIVKGRQTILLRICSCPKRDQEKEEKEFGATKDKPAKRLMKTSDTPNKKIKQDNDKLHTIQLQVKGAETLRSVLQLCLGSVTAKAKQEGREMNDEEKHLEKQYIAMLNNISP